MVQISSVDPATINPVEPSEQARMVLVEAKRAGLPWDRAWLNAMRSFSPPRTAAPDVHAYFEKERALLHEVKPWWQAAYENRDILIEEFEQASSRTEKRLDELFSAVA